MNLLLCVHGLLYLAAGPKCACVRECLCFGMGFGIVPVLTTHQLVLEDHLLEGLDGI